jgi:death-on-curing protein
LATEPAKYLTYTEAVVHHVELMRALGEVRFGIFNRALIESALARPKHAATYDEADLPAQAATLCYGLIKNHPGVGGNKRTATHLTDHFLRINGSEIRATSTAIIAMVQQIEADLMDLTALTRWMRAHVESLH